MKLYHGTTVRLLNGIPNRITGSWFSTSMDQSAMHALAANLKEAVVYEYTVIHPMNILHFKSIGNFDKWATERGGNKGSGVSFIVSAANKKLAEDLCKEGKYDGWSLPSLQKQIMICNPRKFLRLDAVYRVNSNSKNINFVIGNNKTLYNFKQAPGNRNVMWSKVNYTTQKINLGNIRNIYEPNANKIYWYFNRKTPVFINSKGQEIARGQQSVMFNEHKNPYAVRLSNGKTLNIIPEKMLKGEVNNIHRKTLRKRIGIPNAWFYSIKLK